MSRLTVALLLFALTGRTAADPVLITFDDQTPGLSGHSYADLGVSLGSITSDGRPGSIGGATGAFNFLADPLATTAPNVAHAWLPANNYHWDLLGEFVLPYFGDGNVLRATTNAVSLWVTAPPGADGWLLEFYGPGTKYWDIFDGMNNNVLAIFSGEGSTFVHYEGDVAGFILFSPSGREGVDNLAFETPAIPQPATVFLLVVGLLSMATWKMVGKRGYRCNLPTS